MAKVCVYAELSDGKLNSAVPEIMARARELGDVSVVALGTGAKEAAATLGKHGAKVAYVKDAPGSVGDGSKRAHILERVPEASEKVKLEDARVVISGGRGMGGPDNFPLLEDLAGALGGAVGASRAVVDAGWVPYSMQA